jgi:hypothetical protein
MQRSRDGSIAGTRVFRQGLNDIRDHKGDKAAVAQVAARHRQKMQVQLEDTMSKYNQLSHEHAVLQVSGAASFLAAAFFYCLLLLQASTSQQIQGLKKQNAQLSAQVAELYDVQSTNRDPDSGVLRERIVVLEEQLALSRSNFQSLSKHSRSVEQANYRVQVCIVESYTRFLTNASIALSSMRCRL